MKMWAGGRGSGGGHMGLHRARAVALGLGAGGHRRLVCYLLEQRVVGAVQVELAQVVPVGEDQKWLFVWRQRILAQPLAGGHILAPPGPQPVVSSAVPAAPLQCPATEAISRSPRPVSPVTALQLWGSPLRGA